MTYSTPALPYLLVVSGQVVDDLLQQLRVVEHVVELVSLRWESSSFFFIFFPIFSEAQMNPTRTTKHAGEEAQCAAQEEWKFLAPKETAFSLLLESVPGLP